MVTLCSLSRMVNINADEWMYASVKTINLRSISDIQINYNDATYVLL